MAVAVPVAGGNLNSNKDTVKKVQIVHKIPQDGIYGPVTRGKVIGFQKQQGISQTGNLDSATIYQYKRLWPALFGANSSSSPAPTTNNGVVVDPLKPGGILEMVIKTVLLYGMFKVLMKVF
jgi:peptidoglycan hydrolase-like protein with peptidoglycan-binding domain